jgi:beta-amylase
MLFVAVVVLVNLWVATAIDVNVMLPLNVISSSMEIYDYNTLKSRLTSLKSAGVKGVMSDCWFGLVESQEKTYNFKPYLELTQLAKDVGLTVQYVMSFHKCGGNVGDDCNIPLPTWVLSSGVSQGDIVFDMKYFEITVF